MSNPYQQPSFEQPPKDQPGSVQTPYGAFGPPGQADQFPPKPSSGNGCMWGCLIGGLVGLVVLIAVCVGGAYYITANFKSFAATAARSMAVSVVQSSELSDEDKTQVVGEIDRVVDAYKRGDIDEKDLQNILEEVGTSPLIPLAVVYGVEKQYLDKSGLTDEEKADARRQLQRLVRGGMEKKIDQPKIDALLAPLQQTGPNDEKQMKQHLTDAELRTFVADAKKLADEAMIPDEEFKVDIGDEVKRIVDRGLSKGK